MAYIDCAEELWRFDTARFSVVCEALPEDEPDLSWDDDGTIKTGIESGEFDLFCAKVSVLLDGHEICADYLGNCVYRPGEFIKAGGYFADMVRTAIKEARKILRKQAPYIRPNA
ncbi:MAG: hypothetical protein AB7F96_17650 [Beijerinckiaceae bacterium]